MNSNQNYGDYDIGSIYVIIGGTILSMGCGS